MQKKVLAIIVILIISLTVLTACDSELATPNDQADEPSTEDINTPSENQNEQEEEEEQFVLENEAFKIYEPTPNAGIQDSIVIRGLARVFEGTVQYEIEDGHYILDKGFTTATEGAPGWGEFEIIVELDQAPTNGIATVILYEESAKDGSRLHELFIPVNVID